MKTDLPHLLNQRLQLDLDGHRYVPELAPAADQLTLRQWAERVKKVNRRNALLVRMRQDGALHTRVARRDEDRIEVDTVKAPGRRYGPTPLRLLLPQEGRAARPLDSAQRVSRYAGRRGYSALTPRQRRRIDHKHNHALKFRES